MTDTTSPAAAGPGAEPNAAAANDDQIAKDKQDLHQHAQAFEIAGTVYPVPRSIAHDAPAIDAWYAATELPHAEKLAAAEKIDVPVAQRTGHKGALALSDVQRAIIARDKNAAATAAAAKGGPKPPTTGRI